MTAATVKAKLPGVLRAALTLLGLIAAFWLGGAVLGNTEPGHTHSAAAGSAAESQTWTCSMHPQIKLPEPGSCPICGMDLIPLVAKEKLAPNQVTLSDAAKKLASIRTTKAVTGRASSELRLLGKIEYDERRVSHVTSWIAGRINRLSVSAIGTKIRAGQHVASVYSPDVYAAQRDLMAARRQRKALKGALPVARRAAKSTYESAKTRLSLLGFGSKSIAKMSREKKPRRSVGISATQGGTVIEQMVQSGDFVNVGQPLFKVASLKDVWVQLDAYASDLPSIRVGQKVQLSVASLPDQVFEGQVAFIDPVVDRNTRTARVRVEVDNKDKKLRPGLFAEAVLLADSDGPTIGPVMIPKSAPLFTGERAVVFIVLKGKKRPTYEAREVQLGPESGDRYPVLEGLNPGEEVVTYGAFTLDSELQINGGKSMMQHDDDLSRGGSQTYRLSASAKRSAAKLVDAYLELQATLSADEAQDAQKAAIALANAAAVKLTLPQEASEAWKQSTKVMLDGARGVETAEGLATQRKLFIRISSGMMTWLSHFGNPTGEAVHVAFCPMADGNNGAQWLQRADKVENPYFGSKMYRCGDVQAKVGPGEYAIVDKVRGSHAH